MKVCKEVERLIVNGNIWDEGSIEEAFRT